MLFGEIEQELSVIIISMRGYYLYEWICNQLSTLYIFNSERTSPGFIQIIRVCRREVLCYRSKNQLIVQQVLLKQTYLSTELRYEVTLYRPTTYSSVPQATTQPCQDRTLYCVIPVTVIITSDGVKVSS